MKDPWIPCSDRLPEDGQTVAFVVECEDQFWHGRVFGGRYFRRTHGDEFSVPGIVFAASHWMPLPDPPAEIER